MKKASVKKASVKKVPVKKTKKKILKQPTKKDKKSPDEESIIQEFENETGKKAIWRGKQTKQFNEWKKEKYGVKK